MQSEPVVGNEEPAASIVLHCDIDGLDELKAKLVELNVCLGRASELMDEISGAHELGVNVVDGSAR